VIVVVSSPDDPHAARVIGHLDAAGRESFLLDLSDLPERASLTVDYDGGRIRALELGRDGGDPVDLTRASAVWWRRPQAPRLEGVTDANVEVYAHNEWQEALDGLWQLLDARWINDPVRDEVAARKAHQLRIAAEIGLRVPRTLITSDPARAKAFIQAEGVGATIYKSFSCTHAIWTETRLVGAGELARLDSVRLAPAIFQEHVPAGVDVRATVIGQRIFAAAIDARATDYPLDFRMSLGQADVRAVELPAEVEGGLLALTDRLGLVYGAVDLRLTEEGEYVFFELNTAGEFLFVEERTGQPIAQALAEELAIPA
jgi:hypothetical protein